MVKFTQTLRKQMKLRLLRAVIQLETTKDVVDNKKANEAWNKVNWWEERQFKRNKCVLNEAYYKKLEDKVLEVKTKYDEYMEAIKEEPFPFVPQELSRTAKEASVQQLREEVKRSSLARIAALEKFYTGRLGLEGSNETTKAYKFVCYLRKCRDFLVSDESFSCSSDQKQNHELLKNMDKTLREAERRIMVSKQPEEEVTNTRKRKSSLIYQMPAKKSKVDESELDFSFLFEDAEVENHLSEEPGRLLAAVDELEAEINA